MTIQKNDKKQKMGNIKQIIKGKNIKNKKKTNTNSK